jgi:DNA topoisomerase-1
LNGRWGAYIAIGKNNYKIPKGTEPVSLSLDDCLKIAAADKKPAKPAPAKKGAARAKK